MCTWWESARRRTAGPSVLSVACTERMQRISARCAHPHTRGYVAQLAARAALADRWCSIPDRLEVDKKNESEKKGREKKVLQHTQYAPPDEISLLDENFSCAPPNV